jgi:hypothetical protein
MIPGLPQSLQANYVTFTQAGPHYITSAPHKAPLCSLRRLDLSASRDGGHVDGVQVGSGATCGTTYMFILLKGLRDTNKKKMNAKLTHTC